MAKQPTTNASGNATSKTTPGPQPAPNARPPEYAKDYTFGRSGYGANAYGGASSDLPGTRTRADMTVNNDDTDPVLNTIRQHGTAAMVADPTGSKANVGGMPASQLRDVSKNQMPVTYGMKTPNTNNPKIG